MDRSSIQIVRITTVQSRVNKMRGNDGSVTLSVFWRNPANRESVLSECESGWRCADRAMTVSMETTWTGQHSNDITSGKTRREHTTKQRGTSGRRLEEKKIWERHPKMNKRTHKACAAVCMRLVLPSPPFLLFCCVCVCTCL